MAKRNSLLELTLILCVAVALTAGFSFWLKSTNSSEPLGGLVVGSLAPDIRATGWLNGEPPTASERAGKVVVVNAWYTTCLNCHLRAPEIAQAYEQFHERGVVFIGLTFEEADMLADIRKSVDQMEMIWPNGYGARNTLESFEVVAFPTIWIIGGDGTIVWNSDSSQPLHEAVESALAATGL